MKMGRYLLLVLGIIALLGITTSAFAAEKMETFKIPNEKIEILKPANWEINKRGKDGEIDYRWVGPKDEATIGVAVTIKADYPDKGFLFDTLTAEQKANIEKAPAKGSVRNPKFVKLSNGHLGLRLEFWNEKNEIVGVSLSVIRGRESIILLVLVKDSEKYSDYKDIFEKSLKSFKVD